VGTDALSHDDTTVSALARHLGVAWHTAWVAIEAEAKARVGKPERLRQVRTLGVDEHIWRPSRIGQDRGVTVMVDLIRDKDGCLHARLLDAVVGRSGTALPELAAEPAQRIHRRHDPEPGW
jgi:transposase